MFRQTVNWRRFIKSSDELSIYRKGPMAVVRDEFHTADVGLRHIQNRPRYARYALTLSFIAVAMVFIAIAAAIVNRVVGSLAEDNLKRISEENTVRSAMHHLESPMPLSLESLAGPDRIPSMYRKLIEGLNIAKTKIVLFDLNGYALWSTHPANVDTTKPKRKDSIYWEAAGGDVASKFVLDGEITDLDGVSRRIEVLETYMPLRDTPAGEMIGVLEIYRDVSDDIAVQVQDAKRTVLWTTVATMGGLFLALLGFIVVADLSIDRSRRRERQVAGELAIEVQERTRANEEIQRTATAPQVANKELETFSYSVSHDLRAPLRSLDGFSQILLEDFGNQLDEVGNGYLQRIRVNSQRMSQLIDDMLKLSRVSRGQIQYEQVDLSALVESICNDLRETQPDRDVTLDNAKGLAATGDPALLRAALENLLGNAWKYTGKLKHAAIEFGSARENGRDVYFVKDNGVGFDMAYADKLFMPFHRLHAEGEFDGTGIGLATVHRIIQRHGGSIWAESKPDLGATFYFTLS